MKKKTRYRIITINPHNGYKHRSGKFKSLEEAEMELFRLKQHNFNELIYRIAVG